MKPHDTFLELAAAAIDFPLAPPERGRLEAHLASCAACLRSVAGIRADALAMGSLPRVILPERRGAGILASALHPGVAVNPLRLVAIVALLALLLLGSLFVGAELLRRNDEDLSVVPPVPTASPAPDASAGPSSGPRLPLDTLIAYGGLDGDSAVVRTVRADGQQDRTLAQGDRPAWSPDGRSIAFVCQQAEANAAGRFGDICVMDLDGVTQRVVLTDGVSPRWSPDGRQIMFSRSVVDAGDTWVANSGGSNPRKIGDGAGSWSPDGGLILLLGASGAVPDAMVIRPDGTGARKLGECWNPAWNPFGGGVLACTSWDEVTGTLRSLDTTTGLLTTLFTTNVAIGDPTWIASDLLAVTMTRSGTSAGDLPPQNDLYLLDLSSGSARPRQLTSGLSVTGPIDVSPDGTWLVFTVSSDAGSAIYVVSQGGDVRRVTSDGAWARPQWQPRPPGTEPSPPPTPAPFSKLGIESIQVGDEAVAWASTGDGLIRTTDGGASWSRIQPPAAHVTHLSVATDADTLFIVGPEPDWTVWVTRDGGGFWAQVPFLQETAGAIPKMAFVTPDHGYATFSAGSALHVYETTDAGRTWTGPAVGALPSGMSKVQGPENGLLWLSSGKADNKPFDNRLLLSYDGGTTWQEGRFPTGAQAPRNDLKSVEALWADGRGRVVLAMSLGEGPQIYVSDDSARTWRFVRGWQSFVSGNTTISYNATLLSDREWVLFSQDGSGSWSTLDGGATWKEVSGTPTALLDEVSVASQDRAWAVHRCDLRRRGAGEPDPACADPAVDTILLTTSDGGRTWTRIAD